MTSLVYSGGAGVTSPSTSSSNTAAGGVLSSDNSWRCSCMEESTICSLCCDPSSAIACPNICLPHGRGRASVVLAESCPVLGAPVDAEHSYDQLPRFLHGNPYIRNGYRSLLTARHCAYSVFRWHNETINIWSHLIGYLFCLYLAIDDNAHFLPFIGATGLDHVVVSFGTSCSQLCMLCSVGFHVFHCHSERAFRRWLGLDLTGISIGLVGCYIPALYYGFYCFWFWRDFYILSIVSVTALLCMLQFHPNFLTHEWARLRIVIYSALALFGILPTCHWAYLQYGNNMEVMYLFLPKIVQLYAILISATLFYLSKFPERLMPGWFDFVGSSHQIWHLLILYAFYYWHKSGLEFLRYSMTHKCQVVSA